jgi:biofilm PGA synthesis protein PgaD
MTPPTEAPFAVAPVPVTETGDPGPGPWDRSGLVIEQPELQPRTQRAIYGAVTAVAWVVWAYLWLPLVTLIAWYFGVRAFIREIVIPDRVTLLLTGVTYLAVIAVLGGALLAWSQYNLRRFGGAERRLEPRPIEREEVLAWFDISSGTLDAMQDEGSMVVEHGAQGEVTRVRRPEPGAWPVRQPGARPPVTAERTKDAG